MKEDRATTLLGVLAAISGLLAISTGRWIIGGLILLLAFGIFWNRGGGKFNDRSIYEKVVKTDLSIADLYEKIKDLDTPLGKAWIGGHKGFEGDSIIFGPTAFKDCVVISRKKKILDIKHITLVDNLIRGEEDEYRFRNFINSSEVEVTPKRYSIFVSFKIASVMLIRHLTDIIEELADGGSPAIPQAVDIYTFYYHNSTEGYFRDEEGNNILRVENSTHPFKAAVFDTDGNEMASAAPRAFDAKGAVIDSAGFDLFADGEHFGEILKVREKSGEGFVAKTDAGEFSINIFPACRRANVSCNYTVEQNGVIKAVIGGSPNIMFESVDRCQNDVILSYDDDFLVLYAILEIFIMTLNKKFLK